MDMRQKKQGDWGAFIATMLVVGFTVGWALIPSKMLEETWNVESRQIETLAGTRTGTWIKSQAMSLMDGVVRDAEKTVRDLGESGIERWLADRIYTSVLWLGTIAYRAYALLMWLLLAIPLLLAAAVDGFYVREIRKNAFISQSPIRHKIGVHFMRIVGIAIVIWLMLPVPMPLIMAPVVLLFKALAIWLWMANLQKRL